MQVVRDGTCSLGGGIQATWLRLEHSTHARHPHLRQKGAQPPEAVRSPPRPQTPKSRAQAFSQPERVGEDFPLQLSQKPNHTSPS